jgi:hypothetical protein
MTLIKRFKKWRLQKKVDRLYTEVSEELEAVRGIYESIGILQLLRLRELHRKANELYYMSPSDSTRRLLNKVTIYYNKSLK